MVFALHESQLWRTVLFPWCCRRRWALLRLPWSCCSSNSGGLAGKAIRSLWARRGAHHGLPDPEPAWLCIWPTVPDSVCIYVGARSCRSWHLLVAAVWTVASYFSSFPDLPSEQGSGKLAFNFSDLSSNWLFFYLTIKVEQKMLYRQWNQKWHYSFKSADEVRHQSYLQNIIQHFTTASKEGFCTCLWVKNDFQVNVTK